MRSLRTFALLGALFCLLALGAAQAGPTRITRGTALFGGIQTGTLNIGGTAVSATAAELNKNAGVTAGTVTASKALVVDANKDLASLRDVTTRKLAIGDSANDNTIQLLSASDEGANRTLTVPALGANDTLATLGATNPFTGRLTTTDGVGSGTARVVGGRAYSNVAASDDLLASAGASAHVDFANTYSIPANTLKTNSILRIKAMVQATNASGTDTLETKLYIGGTTLVTTTAFDPDAAADFVQLDYELVARAAPGATASCTGMGRWVSSDGGSLVHGAAILVPTNLATNGALVVKLSAKWSSTTASTNARLEILDVEIL